MATRRESSADSAARFLAAAGRLAARRESEDREYRKDRERLLRERARQEAVDGDAPRSPETLPRRFPRRLSAKPEALAALGIRQPKRVYLDLAPSTYSEIVTCVLERAERYRASGTEIPHATTVALKMLAEAVLR